MGRVSGAGDVPATAAAHAGVGHVDKLHKGDQGAANRRHAKGLEAGALAEDRTKLLIRGVGRKISNVQGEGWRISRARGAGGGGKRGCSVRLGPIVPSTVCRTAVRAVCLALVPGVQLVSQCGHGDGVRGDTCSTVEEQQAGAGPWELEGGYAGSNIFIILAITTSCRAVCTCTLEYDGCCYRIPPSCPRHQTQRRHTDIETARCQHLGLVADDAHEACASSCDRPRTLGLGL